MATRWLGGSSLNVNEWFAASPSAQSVSLLEQSSVWSIQTFLKRNVFPSSSGLAQSILNPLTTTISYPIGSSQGQLCSLRQWVKVVTQGINPCPPPSPLCHTQEVYSKNASIINKNHLLFCDAKIDLIKDKKSILHLESPEITNLHFSMFFLHFHIFSFQSTYHTTSTGYECKCTFRIIICLELYVKWKNRYTTWSQYKLSCCFKCLRKIIDFKPNHYICVHNLTKI